MREGDLLNSGAGAGDSGSDTLGSGQVLPCIELSGARGETGDDRSRVTRLSGAPLDTLSCRTRCRGVLSSEADEDVTADEELLMPGSCGESASTCWRSSREEASLFEDEEGADSDGPQVAATSPSLRPVPRPRPRPPAALRPPPRRPRAIMTLARGGAWRLRVVVGCPGGLLDVSAARSRPARLLPSPLDEGPPG